MNQKKADTAKKTFRTIFNFAVPEKVRIFAP
jgi:hypothetical protein